MIGTVEFYALPGSISTGEYPVLTTDQDISGYLVHSEPKCKYTKDLLQAVGPIAVFDGYDNVNIAKIGNEFYWVVDWTTQSLQQECVTFGLSYNAPTSQLRLGQALIGVFNKTPTMTRDYLSATISNDAMKASREIVLPNMGDYIQDEGPEKLFWIEIVSTGYTHSGTHHDVLTKTGFFVTFNKESLSPGESSVVAFAPSTSSQSIGYYPRVEQIIDNPEAIGLQGDEIIQVSITERCPYEWERRDTSYAKSIILTGYASSQITSGSFRFYRTSGAWPNKMRDAETIQMTLSDMERMCGSVRIVNENGSAIATIPTQYGATISLDVRTYADYTGIYTELTYDGRLVAQLNEGHLPWTGSAWLQYQARQLEADRQMVALANDQARADLNISLRQSEMNQIMSQVNAISSVGIFNPGSFVGAGLGIIEADIKGRQERDAMAQRNAMEIQTNDTRQRLTEKMMKAEPGTAYSMGYGLIYGKNTIEHPANLRLEMPANLTSSYYNDFMAEYGYPAEGKQTLVLSAGFIQGQIINNGTLTGHKFDELSRTIQNGLKIRSIT